VQGRKRGASVSPTGKPFWPFVLTASRIPPPPSQKKRGTSPAFRVLKDKGAMIIARPFDFQANPPTRIPSPLLMNSVPQTPSSRLPSGAGRRGSRIVPVHDVQWGRPVFRPPELPLNPRLFNTVPFTAMRPLQPTRRGRHELAY
jgi:hypothetical protein